MDRAYFVLMFLICFIFGFCFCRTYVSRETVYGKMVGRVVEPIRGIQVEQFLGIPYASPPIGKLRFERPEKPSPWDGEYNANSYPPACPQMIDFHYINLHRPFFQRENEDCLYLNIYVPRRNQSDKKYPVLFYIHGGSNEVGMGAMFDGDVLAGVGEIVVVTFNYRLGAFGFLGAKKEGLEGNYGFLDQVAAMTWVRDNIFRFDGDPKKITIDGHSAGAADVGFHLVSPLTRGLFRFAIVQSGSPLAFWAMSRPEWSVGNNINEQCKNISCPMGQKTKKHLSYKEYLKTLPTKFIQNMPGRPTPGNLITFPAVVDGHFLTDRPIKSLKEGTINGESFLLSFTKDEGSQHGYSGERKSPLGPLVISSAEMLLDHYKGAFADSALRDVIQLYRVAFPEICGVTEELIMHEYGSWEPQQNNSALRRFTEMLSDFVFVAPMINMADVMSQTTKNLFLFSFAHESACTQSSGQGVPHGRDLFYLFGAPLVGHPLYSYTDQDKKASRMMIKLWSNFVKTGKPLYEGNSFRTYNSKSRPYLQLLNNNDDVIFTQKTHFKPRKMAFWNSYLPLLGAKRKCNTSCKIQFLSAGNAYRNEINTTTLVSVLFLSLRTLYF